MLILNETHLKGQRACRHIVFSIQRPPVMSVPDVVAVNQSDTTPPVPTTNTDAAKRHQEARDLLSGYLNRRMRVFLSDGRVIIGNFLCTDRDSNLVLGNCEEYLSQDDLSKY